MRNSRRLAALALVLCLISSAALAVPVYSLRFDGQPTFSYEVASGATVPVNIYLYEILGGGDTSRLIAGNGLAVGGARLSLVSTTGGTDSFIAGPATANSNLVINSGFDDAVLLRRETYGQVATDFGPGPSGTTPIAGLTGGVDFFSHLSGITPETVSGAESGYRVLLGTFNFTGGSMGNTITIQASRLSNSTVNNSTYDPFSGIDTDLDQFLTGTYTATITVVPEPPTIVAFSGLATVGVGYWFFYGRRRRRRRSRPGGPAVSAVR